MTCCNEYTDLGCLGSCEDQIALPGAGYVSGHSASDYQISVVFPDVVKMVTPITGGTDLVFDNILNEDYTHRISVHYRGELKECFKVKIYPELCP